MPTSIWKGQLSFGLVSIPVRLQRAARKERIPLHFVSRAAEPDTGDTEPDAPPSRSAPDKATAAAKIEPTLSDLPLRESPAPVSRVRQSLSTRDEDQPVSRDQLMRGYEVAPEQFVTLANEELRALRPATSAAMEIVRSVRLEEIDPVFFETSYYVVPEPAGERAYALLFSALRDTGLVALAAVAMHGRDHVIVVRPGRQGLIAHSIFYLNEVRAESEYRADTAQANPKELELAKQFTQAIAGPFAPEEFKDEYRARVEGLIAAKKDRDEVSGLPTGTAAPTPRLAPVTDIMDALRKSLAMKKPPAPAKTSAHQEKVAVPKQAPRKRRA